MDKAEEYLSKHQCEYIDFDDFRKSMKGEQCMTDKKKEVSDIIFDCLYKCCDNGLITKEQRTKCILWLKEHCEQKLDDKIKPKFEVGDTMRTLKEAADGWTDGMPVVVSIDEENYRCTNETIAIKDQDEYEYPPINRRHSTNKVKPIFQVDDWVVNKLGDVWHIDSFDKENYQVSNGSDHNYFPIAKQNEMHLWNLHDAMDGDVLQSSINKPFIYNGKFTSIIVGGYCGLDLNNYFVIEKCTNDTHWTCNKDIKPATKEQRILLFHKMHTAGYEWDPKTKELKEIKENHALSEDDKHYYNIIQCCINNEVVGKTDKENAISWFQSLKDRLQPQNGYNPYKEVVESIAEMCKHYDKASHSGLRDFYNNVNVKCKDAKEYDSLFPQKQ